MTAVMSTPESSENAMRQPTPNSIEWNELITPDPGAGARFYCELFGWTTEAMPLPGMPYTMFKLGERAFGGTMAPQQPGIPAHWLPYVSVANIEDAVAKATGLGGAVIVSPMSIGEAGRIAVLKDPQGAVFGLHQAG